MLRLGASDEANEVRHMFGISPSTYCHTTAGYENEMGGDQAFVRKPGL